MSLFPTKIKTIEEIVAPMQRVIADLHAHADNQARMRDDRQKEIERLNQEVEASEEEITRASRLIEKYENLIA